MNIFLRVRLSASQPKVGIAISATVADICADCGITLRGRSRWPVAYEITKTLAMLK